MPLFVRTIEKPCVNIPSAFSGPGAAAVFSTVNSGVTPSSVRVGSSLPAPVPGVASSDVSARSLPNGSIAPANAELSTIPASISACVSV